MKKTKIEAGGASALFWVAVGVIACYEATLLGVGSVTEPGAGFIFFWSGLILVILSLFVLAASIRGTDAEVREIGEMNWRKIILVLLSLLLYAFFLERLGFVLMTFLLLSFLLGCVEDTSWGGCLAVAGGAAIVSYGIFELWLKIRLPKGVLGF